MRLAFIVSHPIQYYVPIYRELAKRVRSQETGERGQGGQRETGDWRPKDEERKSFKDQKTEGSEGAKVGKSESDKAQISALKVFYTWRDAGPALDEKFGKVFAWDIPLMEGYDSEVVPNTSADPGTHHRRGLINPDLIERVKAWKPDAVHITGYNYVSHGQAIRELSKAGIPVIFRGDSHLLDGRGAWWKWQLKKWFVSRIYRCPSAFPYVGQANCDYYRAFGVPERKLFHVPHTIEVGRFAEPNDELEGQALAWRRELGIPDNHFVFLYAAKLEPRKRPMELLDAFLRADLPKATLVFVGSGELDEALKERAGIDQETKRLRDGETSMGQEAGDRTQDKAAEDCKLHTANSRGNVVFLEFQNQARMPLVYRLGDALVLPSGYGETWGLAVNEAQACGRPSLVSDCVGCARDIVREGENGMVFRTDDWDHCIQVMKRMAETKWRGRRERICAAAWEFDTARGVEALLRCMRQTA